MKKTLLTPLWAAFLVFCLTWPALVQVARAAGENQITALGVTQGQDDIKVLKISFRDAVTLKPVHFTTANPHRIVLDFPQTHSNLGRLDEAVNQGVVKAYNLMQSGERARVVVDLTGPATYDVRQAGSHILVSIKGEPVLEGAQSSAHFAAPEPGRGLAIRDVDFKRGKDGEGRIIVTLSDPGVGLDIKEQGRAIQVDFLNTALPQQLQRRLDVADFATPVQQVETFAQGKNTRMKIVPTGKWDYSAYQIGNQFILELRALDATQAASADRPRYSGEKLSLNFQNVEVRSVLQVIADFTGLNIISSDTVTGTLSLRLKDVPWDQALDIILRAKGLDKRMTGNVIWVAPRDELAAKEKLELEARQQIADLEDLAIQSFSLNFLKANEAQAILNGQSVAALQSGESVSCEGAGSIGGTSTTSTSTSTGGSTNQKVLSKRGTTSYDLKSNILFVQDTPAKLQEISELLAKIDVPTKQVMIEARIVVADNRFGRQLGVKLGYQFGGGLGDVNIGVSGTGTDSRTNAVAGNVGSDINYNVNLPTSAFSGPSLGFTLLGASTGMMLNLELQALEADNRGKVISNPRVITQNRKPAVIMQGKDIPYQTVSTSGTQTSFKPAVLCLLVDPQVLNNDNIILDVEVRKDTQGADTSAGPIIDKQRVRTQVHMKNGETVVLGGIFEQTLRNDTEKVPLLGDLPWLGNLFRSNTKRDEKSELLIFLTPRVLTSDLNF